MNFGSSMNSDTTPRKLGGIKIVDNYLNKRVSDIFNVRSEITFDNKNHYLENKIKTAQVVEQRMENKLRNISPYIGGQKNPAFKSQNEVNNNCLGEYKKFDLKRTNNNDSAHDNNRVTYENQDKKKFEGITKVKSNYRRYSSFGQEEHNNNYNNNSKVDNNSSVINSSNRMRNKLNNEKANKSYYENNSNLKDRSYSPITHRRNQHVDEYINVQISGTDAKEEKKNISYFEEFNKKNNEILSSRIRDKSQKRLDLTNKAAERLLKSPNKKTEKEILQDVPSLPFEEKLSKDYIKEKAFIKAMEMEEIRNKIKIRNEKRDEIHQYWEMNDKLIDKSTDNKENFLHTSDDKYFKDYKELSIKVKNDEKIKTDLHRKLSSRGSFENTGIKKVTEFCKMSRDLSKIQLKKNIIAKEQETERKMVRSRSTIQGRNLFNVRDY